MIFVRGASNLRQVFIRHSDDGFFPAMKHIHEMEASDVEPLIKNNLTDTLKKVIERENLDPKLTHSLIC